MDINEAFPPEREYTHLPNEQHRTHSIGWGISGFYGLDSRLEKYFTRTDSFYDYDTSRNYFFNKCKICGMAIPQYRVWLESDLDKHLIDYHGKVANEVEDIFGIYDDIVRISQSEDIGLPDLMHTIQLRTDPSINPDYGRIIADIYEEKKHDPEDPKTKQAYSVFIRETIQQATDLQKQGLQFDPNGSQEGCRKRGISINCGQDGNYADANELFIDVIANKHIYYKESTGDYEGTEDHPLYQMTDFKNIDGKKMRANDLFRAVHDVNGHTKCRGLFTPEGEQRAYLEHKKMYSIDGIRALFTETQGQGNWVNFNRKSGEKNMEYQESGDLDKIEFPEQKAFIFPDPIIF